MAIAIHFPYTANSAEQLPGRIFYNSKLTLRVYPKNNQFRCTAKAAGVGYYGPTKLSELCKSHRRSRWQPPFSYDVFLITYDTIIIIRYQSKKGKTKQRGASGVNWKTIRAWLRFAASSVVDLWEDHEVSSNASAARNLSLTRQTEFLLSYRETMAKKVKKPAEVVEISWYRIILFIWYSRVLLCGLEDTTARKCLLGKCFYYCCMSVIQNRLSNM